MTTINLILEPTSERSLVYYAGQLLKGIVELSLEREKNFRGFYVVVFGQARAHWTETRTRSSGSGKNRRITTHTVHYVGKEVYLNSKTYLFGQSGGSEITIQPGIHRYNFACQLPDKLPYTLDASHGNIGYYVEVVLDIPWRFDKEIKTPFTVVRHDDLNIYPELRIGQQFEEVKTFCCLCCESEPLFMQVSVPRTGFAKGQSIPVTVEYVNESDVHVLSTLIKLKRSIKFTSQTPRTKTRTDTEKMVEVMARGVNAGESSNFTCNLEIPGIMVHSNEFFCRVITVEYYVEVEGVIGGCSSNPEIAFPIVIGSVPITTENSVQIPSIQPSAPAIDDQQKDDLPPSFDEAVKMIPPDTSLPEPTSSKFWMEQYSLSPSC